MAPAPNPSPSGQTPVPLAYLNGRFLPQSEAVLPLHDAGFIFGATVTDLCRTFHHQLFRLPDHLVRFRQSCKAARFPQPIPESGLTSLAESLVAQNARLVRPEQDLALVLFATPGPIGYYAGLPGGPGNGPPTLGMHTFPLPFGRYVRLHEQGARLIVPRVRHVPAASVDPRIKQRSRLHWWIAEQEVQQSEPGASALLLNAEDQLTETAAGNFFVVTQGRVRTPPANDVLEGISRLTVRELCAELGIPFVEQPLTITDALTAGEAFLSSTSYCLVGVSRINDTPLLWPGPVFERLLDAWSGRVGLDIRRQILSNR
jgi:branched-subunit amino acid aminotransferase/4-amino-4-deoxychorismate lyase